MPVFLKDPNDATGKLRRYDDEQTAAVAVAQLGYTEASADEVEARAVAREQETLEAGEYGDKGGQAFWRAAGAGAFDAMVAPVRLATVAGATLTGAENKDPLGHIISGREFMANVAAVSSELFGDDNAEAAHRHWSEESRKIAAANPWASTTGYLGGQVVGGLGVAGAASSLGKAAASAAASSAIGSTAARRAALSLVTEGAAEGAALSVGEAGEQAWISNQRLTSEQIVGAVGWGTLIGGGAGGAMYGAGAVVRAGNRVGDEARTLFSGPSTTASAATVEEVGARALGAKPGPGFGAKAKDALTWAREKLEAGQSISTGSDPDTIAKYGGLRWDDEARAGRDLYINRDAIIEGAKKDFTRGLTELADAAEPIIDEVRLVGIKKEHVRAHLSDQPVEQIAETRMQADALDDMLIPLRRPGSSQKAKRGKVEPIDREAYVATFEAEVRDQVDDEIADEIEDLLELTGVEAKPGGPSWKRAEQQVLRDRVAPQLQQADANAPVDPREGSMRAEVGHGATLDEVVTFFSRQTEAIRNTTDPAEAYVLLDRTKAALQKWADSLGKYANSPAGGRPTSPEKIQGARKLAEYLESRQEPLRQSLMNEGVWGQAGVNQRAINLTFARYIESNKLFSRRFMHVESVGYMGKDAKRVARDDSTGAFLNRLGRADNVAAEQHLRAHLRATTDFIGAIGDALDIGPKRALLDQARATEKQLTAMLDKLDHTVKVANQIDELIRADSDSLGGNAKTLIGGMIGGAPGAALGWVADVASHPGRLMRQAIGIQRVAKRFDLDLDNGIDAVFARAMRRPEPPSPGAPAAPAPGGAANDAGEEVFKDEASGVRHKLDKTTVAGGAALLGASALADDEGDSGAMGASAGALALLAAGKGGKGLRRLSGYMPASAIERELSEAGREHFHALLKDAKVSSRLGKMEREYDASRIAITADGKPVAFNDKGFAQSTGRYEYQAELKPPPKDAAQDPAAREAHGEAWRKVIEGIEREGGIGKPAHRGLDTIAVDEKKLAALARKTGAAVKALEPEEQLALLDYIEGGGAATFRGLQRKEPSVAGKERFAPALEAFESAVEKLQRTGLTEQIGPLWRGFHLSPEDATRLVNSKVVETGALTSTSFQPFYAKDMFADTAVAREGKRVPVVLKFEHVDRAAPISAAGFSKQYGTGEREALLPSGSKFEVLDVTRSTWKLGGHIEVTLREVKDSPTKAGFVLAGLLGLGAMGEDDGEGTGAAGALAVPFLGKGAVRKAARGGLDAARRAAAHVTASGVAVPLGLRAFMGDHDDKQAAFKERAKEIHGATENMGERIRQIVADGLGEIPRDFPRFASGMTNGLTRGALFLESKLPRSYHAQTPGALGRSTRPVAEHEIAKFARYWSAVNDPVSVLHDLALGTMTSEQVEAVKTVYPELWATMSERLLDRAAKADAKGARLPMQTRAQIGRFVGFETEPAFGKSVLALLDQARGEREQNMQQPPSKVPNLAANISPESMQTQQRAARL